jgi:enediyne biosynthesis protein E4
MLNNPVRFLLAIFMVIFCGCKNETKEEQTEPVVQDTPPLFRLLPQQETGVDFINQLEEGLNTNILMYEYFYNGGGVAAGDINGDDLIDLYFTSNMGESKLYLNEGGMRFKEITAEAGVGGRPGPWKTGVAMADVNGDGKLDIHVSYSGQMKEESRQNQLFINMGNDTNGIPTFEDQAKELGLASAGYSNQIYFFDYDRDGDLDALLLNHNPSSMPVLNEVKTAEILKVDDELRGVRLFKQTNDHFDDVTIKAGISSSALTYGLGVGISDINNDGWPDIYISNDYAVPDFLYINNQNGTFTDKLKESVGHNSQFSMGNDVADINNDGWNDIVTLDMLPEDNFRQKLLLAPDNYSKFELNIKSGFHYQYMRNMLQMNNGNDLTGNPTFSEVGQIAGISNTDWSWAALLADFDNNGWKDLHVTNGYFRDYTNLDFIKYMDDFVKSKGRLQREDVLEIISHMPASNVVNYIFSNVDGLNFTNQTQAWGLSRPSNSNGAAYADLDNDGDLDIVVNNINQPAFIYRNEADKEPDNRYLDIKLLGETPNTQGLGAKVTISIKGKKQSVEQITARGYLSSVSPVLHFGLGEAANVDTLVVRWPTGKVQILTDVASNQVLALSESDASEVSMPVKAVKPLFVEATSPINHQDKPLNANDFKRQTLLINQLSFGGPAMAKGDVNGDGLEDVYVGGGVGQPGELWLQSAGGNFRKKTQAAFDLDSASMDADAVMFDANNDGHIDIYVASGGYHTFTSNNVELLDRLYLNDGKGNFRKDKDALPGVGGSNATVAVADVNGDGSNDIFVGGRVVPGRYPEAPQSYLLINNGAGKFSDQVTSLAPGIERLGMVTDAAWVDLNSDGRQDLVIVGEWMPITVFENTANGFLLATEKYFDKSYKGWWNTLTVTDINGDKVADLLVGNLGVNTQFGVSEATPAEIYFDDFDNNGSVDPIFCYFVQGKSYPSATRDELLDQLSSFRRKFNSYKSYAEVTLADIFSPEELENAGHMQADFMKTSVFLGQVNGKFTEKPLPIEAQYSPVHTITVFDYDADGKDDILLCGNNSYSKLRVGKFDANYGALFKGKGNGEFAYVSQPGSGFNLKGDVRSVVQVDKFLLFGVCQGKMKAYTFND